ncbi:hypothetical protein ACVW0Y_004276 [Pseudomonas sp. TE3786]
MTSPQGQFASALLSSSGAIPEGLHCGNGSDPAARFAVYRNNVLSSLINALADSYPVLEQLVGVEFFRAMALQYVQNNPPRSRLLVQYGDDLAAFIEQFAPARALPYLADMARLEALRIRAYHAADALSLSHAELASAFAASPEPAGLRFQLHPSLQLLASSFAVRSLWAAHQGELAIETVDPYQREYCLVLRQHLDVLVIALDAPSSTFITQLQAGVPLGTAAAACPADFNLSAALALLISHGAIIALSTREPACTAPAAR